MVTKETVNRKGRLSEMLGLAQVYRGWTRKELARALHRDPSKLIPQSANPKLDYVIQLADILDWTVGDVTEWIWDTEQPPPATPEGSCEDFDMLDAKARDAHRIGDYPLMIELAQASRQIAQSADEVARSWNREAGGHDGLGRYRLVLESSRAGLSAGPMTPSLRLLLQATLANALYSLWHLDEARAISREIISTFAELDDDNDRCQIAEAHAWYVLGHSYRRMIEIERENAVDHAKAAAKALRYAESRYTAIGERLHESYSGIAHTCTAGLLEAGVTLGTCQAEAALQRIDQRLGDVVDISAVRSGDWLESYGWWCIFGCNITLRHIQDERLMHRRMAMFTNKADEIANKLDHWPMRERVYTMQYTGHQRCSDQLEISGSLAIDTEDIRMIAGTMGRFQNFRSTGWNLLKTAKIVKSS